MFTQSCSFAHKSRCLLLPLILCQVLTPVCFSFGFCACFPAGQQEEGVVGGMCHRSCHAAGCAAGGGSRRAVLPERWLLCGAGSDKSNGMFVQWTQQCPEHRPSSRAL